MSLLMTDIEILSHSLVCHVNIMNVKAAWQQWGMPVCFSGTSCKASANKSCHH